MANPRIDELKRRIEREPGSRLFAQLAEELRKEGDLPEAIRVSRAGLQAHPNYPSARLTLGRALFESGQLAPARVELEAVLRGAPDNIVAARMLGECLEGLGDPAAALLQYRAALRLAPADRQIEVHVRGLEQRLARAAGPAAAPLPAKATGPAAAPVPPAAPGPTAAPVWSPKLASAPRPSPAVAVPLPAVSDPGPDFDDVFEPAPAWKRPAAAATSGPAEDAILLFEDEAPTLPGSPFVRPRVESASPVVPTPAAPPSPAVLEAAPPEPPPPPAPFQAADPVAGLADGSDTLAGRPAFGPVESPSAPLAFSLLAPAPEPPVAAPKPAPAPEPPMAPASMPAPEEPKNPPMSTPTMAELYFDQGFLDRAVQVYEQVLEREPQNERARARLIEIKALARSLEGPPTADPKAARRQALERTIVQLEQMLSAVRRG